MSEAAHETPFELLERVAGGAFGEVWRARDRASGAVVAVKRLHAHLLDGGARDRFFREAEVLARITDDHVVGLVGQGSDDDGRPWIALEWLEGVDLSAWRALPGSTVRGAVRLVRDAALGAAAVHAHHVVHRDLKPANIRVRLTDRGDERGTVMDLGIAHVGTNVTVLTATGAILGSPTYMSPEQVRGDPVDARTDVWALGVILFEMLTGDTPFGSSNPVATLGKVLLEPIPPLRTVRPDLPDVLGECLARLLERDLDRRTLRASELAAVLTAVLDDANPALDHPIPPPHAPRVDTSMTKPSASSERRLVAMLFARTGAASEESVVASIERFGGRAERLRDVWLGGFGLSRARGDEWTSAARAALRLKATGARVGVVAGWVEVRGGSMTAGQLLDRGAELLDRAEPGEVLVATDTVGRLEAEFAFEARDDRAQRLVDERRGDAVILPGSPILLLGRAVRAVGRDKELRLLEGVYLEATDEHAARMALVVGEGGIGKSRLRYELTERLLAFEAPPTVLCLRAEPMLADAPHAMVSKGFRELVGLEEGEPVQASVQKIGEFATRWGMREPVTLEFFAELLRVERASEGSTELQAARRDPALMRQRLRESLAAVFRAFCAHGAVLLAVEDLHWADRATVDVLSWLFQELGREPWVMLAFARPELSERHPVLWQGVARTELRLAPLSQRASELLISSVITLPEDERHALAQRAAGNPLFLEELVRARAAGVHDLPPAVHAVLQVRLDALGVETRRFAQAAAVFGQTFWLEGVAALRTAGDRHTSLAELIRAEIVVARATSRYARASEYTFRHALVRDAAYAMLVDAEKCELHARAAGWFERMGERDAALVAQHYEVGGCGPLAAGLFVRAASDALAESAFEEARAYASRALVCEPAGETAALALLLRAEANQSLGHTEAMLADACRAQPLSQSNAPLQIRTRSVMAEAFHLRGDLTAADATLRSVLEESHASLLSSRVRALLSLAWVDLDAGRAGEAATLVDEALSWLPEAQDVYASERLQALNARAICLASLGDLGGALAAAEASLMESLAAGHRARVAEARMVLARVLVRVGHGARAYAEVFPVMAEARTWRGRYLEAQAQHAVGLALACEEKYTEAIEAQGRAKELADAMGAQRLVLTATLAQLMHRVERATGDDVRTILADAPVLLDAAIAFPSVRCASRSVLAWAWAVKGQFVRAWETSAPALVEMQEITGGFEHEERVRLIHARVLLLVERNDEADTVLQQALDRLAFASGNLPAAVDRDAFLALRAHRELVALAQERLDAAPA